MYDQVVTGAYLLCCGSGMVAVPALAWRRLLALHQAGQFDRRGAAWRLAGWTSLVLPLRILLCSGSSDWRNGLDSRWCQSESLCLRWP